jgi:hypothetical protein
MCVKEYIARIVMGVVSSHVFITMVLAGRILDQRVKQIAIDAVYGTCWRAAKTVRSKYRFYSSRLSNYTKTNGGQDAKSCLP